MDTVRSMLKPKRFSALILLLAAGGFLRPHVSAAQLHQSKELTFRTAPVVRGLEQPWSLAFLPDGHMLITEKPGRLRLVEADGSLLPAPIAGLPKVAAEGQGGLMDVALHPRFSENRLIYLSYSAADAFGNIGTEVARGRLGDGKITQVRVIFRALPKSKGGRHFGSRLLFDRNGLLYVTLGERGDRDRAQDLSDHAGSIVRIKDDGTVPEDNPFVSKAGAKPEIYTYGNRNVQGIALQPETGLIWAHEHGPQGGDEINILRAGTNFGWPVITYGVNYVFGTKIGEGTVKPGMQQPIHYWVPSIAPSGMTFYDGDKFPAWRGNLFVGALKNQSLVRLQLDGRKVVYEERLLQGQLGRIRDVRQGPDGYIYFLTNGGGDALYRIEPAP